MQTEHRTYHVTSADEGSRLDVFLAERLSDLSRSHIQRLVKDGKILVNDRSAKPGMILKSGMRIDATDIAPPQDEPPQAQRIPLNIVHEDEVLIVIDKPAGMVVHPAPGSEDRTLVNALLAHCADLQGIGAEKRPGIVHRLDKDTSGLLVVAKTEAALKSLTEQLSSRRMGREYLAIVCGNVQSDSGTIDAPIGRSRRDRKKMAVNVENGREATTHYEVLKRGSGLALLRCRLETGRTHQIRVHLAHRNWPVIGDPQYGPRKKSLLAGIPKSNELLRSAIAKIERQMLHAERLALAHPISGETMKFESEMPEDMKQIVPFMD